MGSHRSEIKQILEANFGYTSFRTGQQEIIEDVLAGKDVLGILPTGTGKSLCYQLPSLMLEGVTVVVSPLISLMIDQVKQLKASGFKRVAAIHSLVPHEQKESILNHLNKIKLLYVSPEMLQNNRILQRLKAATVSFFVVDEAHCISQWGHEFRTDYLKLGEIIEQLNQPTILALSATAPPNVQEDIIHYLNRPNMVKRIFPMDRENIAFVVEHVSNWAEKLERIVGLLQEKPVPTMIYFSSRKWCERISKLLQERLPNINVAHYHGGMDPNERLLIQQQFMNNQLDVICCTSAFGMGVNKPDIRLVIHYHLPTQMESYLQEVGRAGRDGKQSIGLVLYSNSDVEIPLSLIEQELPSENQMKTVLEYLYQTKEGPLPSWNEDVYLQQVLNETQWRFLMYQLERHHIVQNNELIGRQEDLKQGLQNILTFVQKRLAYKNDKFLQLLRWIHYNGCRRELMYKAFQKGFAQPEKMCCDQCGEVFSLWKPEIFERSDEDYSWKDRLERIFQVGRN